LVQFFSFFFLVSGGLQDLIPVINKLQDIFTVTGGAVVGSKADASTSSTSKSSSSLLSTASSTALVLELPQIVVVGSQSSGKSRCVAARRRLRRSVQRFCTRVRFLSVSWRRWLGEIFCHVVLASSLAARWCCSCFDSVRYYFDWISKCICKRILTRLIVNFFFFFSLSLSSQNLPINRHPVVLRNLLNLLNLLKNGANFFTNLAFVSPTLPRFGARLSAKPTGSPAPTRACRRRPSISKCTLPK
jgi:hypothetical protein